jgi:hypothetical protein
MVPSTHARTDTVHELRRTEKADARDVQPLGIEWLPTRGSRIGFALNSSWRSFSL